MAKICQDCLGSLDQDAVEAASMYERDLEIAEINHSGYLYKVHCWRDFDKTTQSSCAICKKRRMCYPLTVETISEDVDDYVHINPGVPIWRGIFRMLCQEQRVCIKCFDEELKRESLGLRTIFDK